MKVKEWNHPEARPVQYNSWIWYVSKVSSNMATAQNLRSGSKPPYQNEGDPGRSIGIAAEQSRPAGWGIAVLCIHIYIYTYIHDLMYCITLCIHMQCIFYIFYDCSSFMSFLTYDHSWRKVRRSSTSARCPMPSSRSLATKPWTSKSCDIGKWCSCDSPDSPDQLNPSKSHSYP